MSSTPNIAFVQDSWQATKNARTLRAFMALKNQEIGDRIRDLRGRRPQTVVAQAIGASPRTLQTWEGGVAKPNYRYLQKLAEFFGVTEGYILDGVDDRPIIEGVPEQLEDVDSKFSERVDDVERAIADVDNAVTKFRTWAEHAVQNIIDERALALARANERLVSIESKLDRLMDLVDAGLFTQPGEDDDGQRQAPVLREDQMPLVAALVEAFQAAQPETAPAKTDPGSRSQRAG